MKRKRSQTDTKPVKKESKSWSLRSNEVEVSTLHDNKRQILGALTRLAKDTDMRATVAGSVGLDYLTNCVATSNETDTMLMFQLVEELMHDDGVRRAIANRGGAVVLVRHLQFGSDDALLLASLRALKSAFLLPDNYNHPCVEKATKDVFNRQGLHAICRLCHKSRSPQLRSCARDVLLPMPWAVELIIANIDHARRDCESVWMDALIIMSKHPIICKAIVKCGGIRVLVRCASLHADRAGSINALANMACSDDGNRFLMIEHGLLPVLVKLIQTESDTPLQTATAAALRNLSNNRIVRDQANELALISRAVHLLRNAPSPRLRETTAGLLGNLAKGHLKNQQLIVDGGGVNALVEFAHAASNPRQRQTAVMAIFVLVKENNDGQRQFRSADGLRVIEAIEQLREPQSHQWARRLVACAHPSGNVQVVSGSRSD